MKKKYPDNVIPFPTLKEQEEKKGRGDDEESEHKAKSPNEKRQSQTETPKLSCGRLEPKCPKTPST